MKNKRVLSKAAYTRTSRGFGRDFAALRVDF